MRVSLLATLLLAAAARAQFAPGQLRLVGAAGLTENRLRLTPAREQVVGAAWSASKQEVAAGFDTSFRFQLTDQGGLGHGADGFAFVLQNAGPDAIAGRGASGGFALGDGYGEPSHPGIPHSIAVFFDTYRNEFDPSGNYIALCTNGAIGRMRWPPARLAVSKKLKIHLKDRRVHQAEIRYDPPILTVSIDGGAPVLRGAVDLATVVDEHGEAYVGFTASTGAGYENHDILDWDFNPHATSAMFVVQSGIDFLRTNCIEGKNLCTPAEAQVDPKGPGEYHIVLPANREWGASIANPEGRPVAVSDSRGMACGKLKSADEDCAGPTGMPEGTGAPAIVAPDQNPGALVTKTVDGRTYFSINARSGEFAANQGYFEFDARLK